MADDTAREKLARWLDIHSTEPNQTADSVGIGATLGWIPRPEDLTVGDLRELRKEQPAPMTLERIAELEREFAAYQDIDFPRVQAKLIRQLIAALKQPSPEAPRLTRERFRNEPTCDPRTRGS